MADPRTTIDGQPSGIDPPDELRRRCLLALGIGWTLALLAATETDGDGSGEAPLAPPLLRTLAFRLDELGASSPHRNGIGRLAEAARHPTTPSTLHRLDEEVREELEHLDDRLHLACRLGTLLAEPSVLAGGTSEARVATCRRLFADDRIWELAAALDALGDELGRDVAEAIFDSLERWTVWVGRASDEQLAAVGPSLRNQARLWRELLFSGLSIDDFLHRNGIASARPHAGTTQRAPRHRRARAATPTETRPRPPVVVPQNPRPVTTAPTIEAPVPVDEPQRAARRRHLRRPSVRRRLGEWVVLLALAVGLTFVLQSFAFQVFYVPSISMQPTIRAGDRIVVDKLPMSKSAIRRGDIIVFRRVTADTAPPFDADLVKRVIGLPGERIASRGTQILINGRPLRQPWLPRLTGPCFTTAYDIKPQVIPRNDYFVMGDCRGDSYDSRDWGPVPRSHVIGKVFLVIWRNNHPWFTWF